MSEYQQSVVHPKHVREHFARLEGKRVNVGLVTNHYLCGTWRALDHHEATFDIGGHEMKIKVAEISSVAEAPAFQADFFK